MSMPWEVLLALLLGGGGVFAWLKGRSSGKAQAAKKRRERIVEDAGAKAEEASEAADELRANREKDRRKRQEEIDRTEEEVNGLTDEELARRFGSDSDTGAGG